MFENLNEKLERSFKLLKGQGKISEINIAETLKEVRRALLDADVNFKIAKQFTEEVKAEESDDSEKAAEDDADEGEGASDGLVSEGPESAGEVAVAAGMAICKPGSPLESS